MQAPASRTDVAPIRAGIPSYFELLRTRYCFERDGTGRKEVIARIRILNEMGVRQWGQLIFDYEPFSEWLEIPYVQIVKKDQSIVQVATEVIGRRDVPAGVPKFNHDEKRISVQGLAAGDVLEYKAVTLIRHPLAQGQFWVVYDFQPSAVSEEELEIDIANGRAVKVKANANIEASETRDSETQIYRWRSSNFTPGNRQFKEDPSRTSPDVQLTSFASWEEVGRWYADIERSQRVPTQEVRTKADELTKASHTDLEKVEALYNFTAKKVRYLSLVSLGIGGYEPGAAETTLRKQYGDCKDKTTLLAALLEAEGMHASSVVIAPDKNLDLDIPAPWPFTHVIIVLRIGKEDIWMDPSAAILPFRMLAYRLRGMQALVMPPNGTPYFAETPSDAPMPNSWEEEIDGKVGKNGTLDATVRIVARGDDELPLRQAFLTPTGSMRPWGVPGIVKGIEKSDKVTDIKIGDPFATDKPFTLSFRFNKPIFVRPWEKHSQVALPLSESLKDDAVVEWSGRDSSSIRLGPMRRCYYKVRIEFAKEFKPERPPILNLQHDYASYNANYDLEGNTLTANRTFATYKDDLPLSLVADYAAFQKQMLADMDFGVTITEAESVTANPK